MDAFLKRAVKEHGLTSIGVHLWTEEIFERTATPITVYIHWNDGCKGGNGKTVKAALASALEQMREERASCPYCGADSGLRVKCDGGGYIKPEYTCEGCFTATDTGPCFEDLPLVGRAA